MSSSQGRRRLVLGSWGGDDEESRHQPDPETTTKISSSGGRGAPQRTRKSPCDLITCSCCFRVATSRADDISFLDPSKSPCPHPPMAVLSAHFWGSRRWFGAKLCSFASFLQFLCWSLLLCCAHSNTSNLITTLAFGNMRGRRLGVVGATNLLHGFT